MALFISLGKTVGQNYSSIDDGIKVLQLISPELVKCSTVEVDFTNVTLFITPFISACFGALLERFGQEVTMTHVVMKNISSEFLQRINGYMSKMAG